ncbi:MAG: type II toxin-antitoxin system PemK/MazF family toxin [Gracilibacteraceae bacterium]|nr:type II toxin-antitoxin system PemK/MazF family toxin [Gracilibacteraceae bacterium]
MKSTDIKIGHIYYVDYEPVRDGEFNGKHLSVVLKRNNDKYTFVVMPLTSSANGVGVNKIKIGKVAGLPPNIRNNDTYAVFDQVRTVNANRFMAVKDEGGRIDVSMERGVWLCGIWFSTSGKMKKLPY